MRSIAPSLIALALAAAPLTAADPEYSVFVLPADTGKAAFANGVEPSAISPDGKTVIVETWDNNDYTKSYRWTLGAAAVTAMPLANHPSVRMQDLANNGTAIGEVYTAALAADDVFGFPASASGAAVTKRGTLLGFMEAMSDTGAVIVGAQWPSGQSTSDFLSVYTNARSRMWSSVSATPTNPLAGTTVANSPSIATHVSPNGAYIAGSLLNPADFTANGYVKLVASGEPTVIQAPFLSPDAWDALAVGNDGKAIFGWGDEEWVGFANVYYWNGSALSEVVDSGELYETRDWMMGDDLLLPLLDAWGNFGAVTGKGLVGIVGVDLDSSDAPNPEYTDDWFRARWMNGELTDMDELMPQRYENFQFGGGEWNPITVEETTDNSITSAGQILATVEFPGSSTQAAAILTPVPVVTLTSSLLSKGEAGGTFTATVTRTPGPAGAVNTNWPLTVRLSYLGGATRGTDYTGALSVTIPAGQTSATLTMNIVNDTEVEGPEAFTVRLARPTAGSYTPQTLYRVSMTQNRLTYMITDNDTVAASLDR